MKKLESSDQVPAGPDADNVFQLPSMCPVFVPSPVMNCIGNTFEVTLFGSNLIYTRSARIQIRPPSYPPAVSEGYDLELGDSLEMCLTSVKQHAVVATLTIVDFGRLLFVMHTDVLYLRGGVGRSLHLEPPPYNFQACS